MPDLYKWWQQRDIPIYPKLFAKIMYMFLQDGSYPHNNGWLQLCYNTLCPKNVTWQWTSESQTHCQQMFDAIHDAKTPYFGIFRHSLLTASLTVVEALHGTPFDCQDAEASRKIGLTHLARISSNQPLGLIHDLFLLITQEPPRPASISLSVFVLLISNETEWAGKSGQLAELKIEAVPGGNGGFYQTPWPNKSVDYNDDFKKGLDQAYSFGQRDLSSDTNVDLRWTLELPNSQSCAPLIEGGSAGAAFGFLIDQVMMFLRHNDEKMALDKDWLRGVAITAILEPDFSLRPVGSAFEKLITARHGLTPIHTVVMAMDQLDKHFGCMPVEHNGCHYSVSLDERDYELEQSKGVKGCVYKNKDHQSRFHIVAANTLPDAIQILIEISKKPGEVEQLYEALGWVLFPPNTIISKSTYR